MEHRRSTDGGFEMVSGGRFFEGEADTSLGSSDKCTDEYVFQGGSEFHNKCDGSAGASTS